MTGSVFALLLSAATATAQAPDWSQASATAVERAARDGDKAAALELGRRFEAGTGGLTCSTLKALAWYRRAARTSQGGRLVYSAPVAGERYGRMIPVSGERSKVGLPAAQEHFLALRARAGAAGKGGAGCLPVASQAGQRIVTVDGGGRSNAYDHTVARTKRAPARARGGL
jgi:hypothetical protein